MARDKKKGAGAKSPAPVAAELGAELAAATERHAAELAKLPADVARYERHLRSAHGVFGWSSPIRAELEREHRARFPHCHWRPELDE